MASVTVLPSGKRNVVNILGFWSAGLTSFFTVAFIAASFVLSPKAWHGMASYASEYSQSEVLIWIPCFFFALTYAVTATCIGLIAQEDKRPYGYIGMLFATIYTGVSCLNGYLQVSVLRLNLLAGNAGGLELLALPNPHSVTYAMEALGYGFLGLSTLFASACFRMRSLEGWIKVILILNGTIGLFGLLIGMMGRPALMLPGLGLWCIEYPVVNVLLCVYFSRRLRAEAAGV